MSSYRERALNKLGNNNTSKNIINDNTTSSYRQRALNRQQPKVEENKYNFTPEDAKLAKDMINTRVAMSTARTLPTLIEQKKAEKAEQERWDNLSVGEKIVDPFKTMGANIKHTDLGLKESQAWTEYRNKQDEESLAKAQAATKAREEYEASNDRIGKGNAFTKDFAGYIPQMLGQIGAGVGNAAGGAAAGAGTALAIGQLGPQVGLPEELITVPTGALWGGRAGYVAGTGKYNYDLVVGTAYKTLLDMGVPNDIALELSGNEAVINGAIEALGSVVDLASFGAGSAVKEPLKRFLTGAVKSYVANLISEPTEEGLQKKVSIEIEKEAAKRAGIERNVTEAEDWQSILYDMKAARNVALFTGLGNVGGNIVNNVMQTNKSTNIDTRKLPAIDSKTLNQLTEINKNIEEQQKASETAQPEKNVARELPTMASQQAMLQTNRIEGQTAQTGNMEQMAENGSKSDNFVKGLEKFKAKDYTQKDNIVVLDETPQYLYNLGYDSDKPIVLNMNKLETIMKEPKGTVDGKNQHGITMDIVEQLPNAIQNPLNVIKNPKFNNRFVVVTELTDQYGDIVIVPIEMNTNGYIENIETNVNKIASVYGKEYYDMAAQEGLDSYMEVNKNNIVYDIGKDPTAKRNTTTDYRLQLPSTNSGVLNNSINQNDNSVNTQYAQTEQKGYISPAQDMKKATEFVNKATVEDIDTLNKMVEEAEKYPDRVDLQFFAEKAREAIEKLSRQQVRQAIMEETGVESYNLDDVNKISKAKMNFTTPVRVIEKIFNKETANKINENFFKPIKHNEAERIRRLNKERADIKELDIKPGSAEDAAIQKYGEGEYVDENGLTIPYTLENLKRDFPDTWQKLQNATNVIRNKYDTYLEEINEVLQDNGYDPIPKRKDYFRHFEELNDLFSVLGVPTKVDDIPTDLNGMTADLKPGKQFFANALQRKGNKTTYSAIKGIDGYLDGAMNILYHTKDIQKLRTLDKYIRDTYGQAKGLADANTMTDEQKAKRINQINEGHLSEFAAWLTEYTNALAGKKSRLDRGVEEMFGRKSYKYLNLIKKQVGANMTGLNVNSALSNFISVIQAGPKTNKKALIKGTIDTVKNIFNNDGFIDKSDFLTTRFGADKLAKNWWQKAGDAGQIFMSGTDYFTANLITRSKYQEFLDKGYSETEAIKKADEFADRLMAGRGKGDLPTAFESKMLGIVTQFQLEVTNQLDSIFYDTLHEDYAAESNSKLAKEHPKFYNAASATFILGQLFALAFLYNEGKEELTGTEGGALDPIGTIVDAIKYLTDENLSKPEAIAKIVEDIANQLPFASIFTSGGRIPIKEALPDLLAVAKGEAKLGDEMWNLANLLFPTGGGQLKKTTQGLSTYAKGGSYSKDAEGKAKLKYPVEQTAGNLVKSAVFGKWATPGAKDYIDRGFKPLSANQTEAYEKAMKAGISSDDFFKVYDATRGIEGDKDKNGKTIENSKSKKLKEAIDKATPKLTSKQRKILYDAFNVSKTVQGGSGLPTQSELRANLPKVEIKIEK